MQQLTISLLLVAAGLVVLVALARLRHEGSVLGERSTQISLVVTVVLVMGLLVFIRLASNSETGTLFGYVPEASDHKEPPVWLQAVKIGTLFVAMCLGMTSKFFWDALEAQKPRGKLVLRWGALIKPFLVAPLVFGFIWKTSNSKLDILTACLSYQNGFMWQTVLGKVKDA